MSSSTSISTESPDEHKEETVPPRASPKRQRPATPTETFSSDGQAAPSKPAELADDNQKVRTYDKNKTLHTISPVGVFRMGAGGSLRMAKKRAKRPLVKDVQWDDGKQADTCSLDTTNHDQSVGDGNGESRIQAQPPVSASRRSSASSSKSTLNPRAAVFTSPKKAGATTNMSSDVISASEAHTEPVQSSVDFTTQDSGDSSCTVGREDEPDEMQVIPVSSDVDGGEPETAADAEPTHIAADEPLGTVDKPKKKKKTKRKKKGPNTTDSYDDVWPSLPKGPHDRAYTINDPPAAWSSRTLPMDRDPVATYFSPIEVTDAEQGDESNGNEKKCLTPSAPAKDGEGSQAVKRATPGGEEVKVSP